MPLADPYPSRNGAAPTLLPRIDPVVHGAPPHPDEPLFSGLTRFDRDGYLMLPELFSPAETDELARELQRLCQDPAVRASAQAICEPDSDALRSVFRVQDFSPRFAALAADPHLLCWVQRILDDAVYLHQTRANVKPGLQGKPFPWHADFETWHVEDGMPRMRAVSVALTLTENAPWNGPLMLVPGSHRVFVQCPGHTPVDHYRQSLRRQEYGVPTDGHLRELCDQGGIDCFLGPPGSVVIFDCNLLHGSAGNLSPYPRANLFFVYNAVGNRLGPPAGSLQPRPEYIAARGSEDPLVAAPRV